MGTETSIQNFASVYVWIVDIKKAPNGDGNTKYLTIKIIVVMCRYKESPEWGRKLLNAPAFNFFRFCRYKESPEWGRKRLEELVICTSILVDIKKAPNWEGNLD